MMIHRTVFHLCFRLCSMEGFYSGAIAGGCGVLILVYGVPWLWGMFHQVKM